METVILVEYVEFIIPFFYGLYLYLTFYSPCKEYIVGTRGHTIDTLMVGINSMVLYGSLEFLSLLILYILVKWRFNLNVFHLLGFVLETHFPAIQAKLLLIFTNAAHFNLIHAGK